MSIKKEQGFIKRFLDSDKKFPVLYAIGAGLYPILFYYSNNFTLVNTWMQLGYFIVMFLALPIVLFVTLDRLSKLSIFSKWQKYLLPFLNVFAFLFLLKVCLYGDIQRKISLAIFIVAILFAFFLHKHIKKLVVIQFLLALIGIYTLTVTIIKQYSYSKEWMQQPDNIEQVVFKRKPNVYYIQPDGYVNSSELKKGYYTIDNSEFEGFLNENTFKYYNNFRSNYAFTLSSNSSSFMMKHHYYNNLSNYSEILNDRNIIISKNTVLDIFKNNGYKTHFITEMSYLLLNRPKMGFDFCNLSYDNISYIGRGLDEMQDIITPLKKQIDKKTDDSKFFFIQILAPSHIGGSKRYSEGVAKEKIEWLKKLERSNEMLTKTISTIKSKDPNALILIMADHGGYVGMEFTLESYEKTEDRSKIYSIFSSILAIHWPNGVAPHYDDSLKTPVNVFRILFTFLSEDESYLSQLQPDNSYAIINKNALPGVYQYINENGNITFEKH